MAPRIAKQKQKKTKLVSSPETLPTSKKLKTSKNAQPTAAATDEEDELDARIVEAVESLGVSDGEEEDLGFSRNYFIAKEATGLGNKSRKKISDIDLVDEQELRAALLTLPPKHEKEQAALVDSYKSLYSKWHFQLRFVNAFILHTNPKRISSNATQICSRSLNIGCSNDFLEGYYTTSDISKVSNLLGGPMASCRGIA